MIQARHSVYILFIYLFSCNYHSQGVKETLAKAGNLAETYPDSALILLDSVYYPQELNKREFAEYVLLHIQLKDKACKDIAKDTLIFQVKKYFQKKRNWEKAVLATFYSGRVYQSQGNYENAMQAYLAAETLSEKTKDDNLKGLIQYFIGELYYGEQLYSKAIKRFNIALHYFNQSLENYARSIIIFNSIGNCFLIGNLTDHEIINGRDSAFRYFNKALQLAENRQDLQQMALVRQNLGVTFLEINEIQQAKEQLFHALGLASHADLQPKLYFNLAKVYEKENQKDSALYFSGLSWKLSEESGDKAAILSSCKLLSRLEGKNGNYENALHYHQQYSRYYDLIRDEKERANLLELQQKYDYELIKGMNNRLVIRWQWTILSLLPLAICICSILFVFYRKNQQNKEVLSDTKQTIYQLKEMINHADNSIHAFLVREFDIVKKVSLLDGYLIEDEREKGKDVLKKVNKIIYDKDNFEWAVLYRTMNDLHKGFFDKIKTSFSTLSDLEHKICCLTKSGLNNKEIAIILKSNVNIVQIKKTAIRKKLGISEYGDIAKFMESMINNQ